MQVTKVQIGKKYAFSHAGKLRALMVTDMITVRDAASTKNSVNGFYEEDIGKRIPVENVPVADLQDSWEKYSELVKERAEKQAIADAREAHRKARQMTAVHALASAIGAKAVPNRYAGKKDPDYVTYTADEPVVAGYGDRIEISPHAIEGLIKFFEGLEVS